MNKTPIQWTWDMGPDGKLIPMSGSTWNPLIGCKETSPGCANCYSARIIGTRFSKNPKLPMYHDIATVGKNGHPHFTGARRLVPDRLDEPLRTRKGRKVFVCDMGDLFFEGHPFEDIAAVFGVMALAQQHTFQALTKRTKRAAEFFQWADGGRHIWTAAQQIKMPRGQDKPAPPWPLPNVWIGTSVEDQTSANARIPHLLRVPAAVRFLSMEPLLEAVDLSSIPWGGIARSALLDWAPGEHSIDWIIVGGESGPRARPFDLAWMRSLRDQAAAAGVAFFPKQLGARPYDSQKGIPVFPGEARALAQSHPHHLCSAGLTIQLRDSHGGDEEEWPADLRGLRAFPAPATELRL